MQRCLCIPDLCIGFSQMAWLTPWSSASPFHTWNETVARDQTTFLTSATDARSSRTSWSSVSFTHAWFWHVHMLLCTLLQRICSCIYARRLIQTCWRRPAERNLSKTTSVFILTASLDQILSVFGFHCLCERGSTCADSLSSKDGSPPPPRMCLHHIFFLI